MLIVLRLAELFLTNLPLGYLIFKMNKIFNNRMVVHLCTKLIAHAIFYIVGHNEIAKYYFILSVIEMTLHNT